MRCLDRRVLISTSSWEVESDFDADVTSDATEKVYSYVAFHLVFCFTTAFRVCFIFFFLIFGRVLAQEGQILQPLRRMCAWNTLRKAKLASIKADIEQSKIFWPVSIIKKCRKKRTLLIETYLTVHVRTISRWNMFRINELQKWALFSPYGWRFQGHFKERRNATHFVGRVHISRMCQYL